MKIDVSKLSLDMLNAAKIVLLQEWPEVQNYAKTEFKKIAEDIAMIQEMKLNDEITEERARLHLEIQKNATRTVLLAIQGLGIIAVEQAINAALDVVKGTVNKALGWDLL